MLIILVMLVIVLPVEAGQMFFPPSLVPWSQSLNMHAETTEAIYPPSCLYAVKQNMRDTFN